MSTGRRRAYLSWHAMVSRCTKTGHADYPAYGGAGVTVCPEWLSFEKFYADMGDRPEGMTLERTNGTLGYSADNCTWADRQTQADNRSTVLLLTYGGKTQTATAWARELGLHPRTVTRRCYYGWPVERVLGLTT